MIIRLVLQDRATLESLQALFNQIEEGYEDGQPLHVRDNRQTTSTRESVFKIISEAEFVKMEQSEVQQTLREKHIVVTGMRHEKRGFEEALLDIVELDWVTAIQGVVTFLL